MGMNETPSADRVHIGFFGRRNAGKSSIVNKVTGQELAVVSDVKGTTTDPVSKAMELLPMGPVVIIDTPGLDDEGHLGELRVRKAKQVLNRVDVAVLVVDATLGKTNVDEELIHIFKEKEIPYLVVYNKSDLLSENQKINADFPDRNQEPFIYASAATGQNIYELKEKVCKSRSDHGLPSHRNALPDTAESHNGTGLPVAQCHIFCTHQTDHRRI